MARQMKEADVKARIKSNKASMKDAKKEVSEAMTKATKGEVINAVETRTALASFIKAANAVNSDNAKLISLGE